MSFELMELNATINRLEKEKKTIDSDLYITIKKREQFYHRRMIGLIGICFIDNDGDYHMIIDTPRADIDLESCSSHYINFFQIPVLTINKKENVICEDIFYSAAFQYENSREFLESQVFKIITFKEFEHAVKMLISKTYFKALNH